MENILYRQSFSKYTTRFYKPTSKLPSLIEDNFDEDSFNMRYSDKWPLWEPVGDSPEYGEEVYSENYANPLANITHVRLVVVISENNDKLSIKSYYTIYERNVGKVYFKKHTYLQFVTYNFRTNNLYSGIIENYHKRKNRKQIRCNYFSSSPFTLLYSSIRTRLLSITNNEVANFELDTIKSLINDYIPEFKEHDYLDNIDDKFFKRYLEKKQIKYPNNWKIYRDILTPLPNKKELKEVNYKLVNYVMAKNNINGDKIRKALHTANKIDFQLYKWAILFFGKDFIQNRPYEEIKFLIEHDSKSYQHSLPQTYAIFQTKKEISNCYNIFTDVMCGLIQPSDFIEHISFYNRLKRYEPVRFKANNISSFNKEHMDWTNKVASYESGIVTRNYNKEFIDFIESQIVNDIYPKVLTTTVDYNNESSIQSHCVKTYVKKAKSLIISLRKGGQDTDNRVTLEYHIKKETRYGVDMYYARLIQAKSRFNQKVPDEWDTSIHLITKSLNDVLANKLKVKFTLPTIDVIFKNRSTHSSSKFVPYTDDPNEKIIFYELEWDNIEVEYFRRITPVNIEIRADEWAELPF